MRCAFPNDPARFAAWCDGRTGYPIVDAAMRQLNTTGYMHNRLRMIAASFLVKDLLVDWRLGERYFADLLLDYDLASNNGGWQWAASTGCDAQPYFRIFNPVTQSERFDPDGEFIRRYVPEIAALDATEIHAPWRVAPSISRRRAWSSAGTIRRRSSITPSRAEGAGAVPRRRAGRPRAVAGLSGSETRVDVRTDAGVHTARTRAHAPARGSRNRGPRARSVLFLLRLTS